MDTLHVIVNAYQILIFIGVLVIIVKLHSIKALARMFVEETKFLALVVNQLNNEIKKEEEHTETELKKVYNSLTDIIAYIRRNQK